MWMRSRMPIVRGACLLVLCAAMVSARPAAPAAAPGLVLGVTEDGFRWRPQAAVTTARLLGLSAFRVTLGWTPGQVELAAADAAQFDAMVPAALGLRVVVTVYGTARSAPVDAAGRGAYCAYVRDLLARYPTIEDVVIWNEANLGYFWQPQFGEAGASLAPAAYGRLLAQCWDVLHALRPSVNLITSTSPGGNDNPRAVSNVSHSPGAFVRKLAAAYRAGGRTRPIFDTVGHNPYGASSAEPPSRRHLAPSHIAQGDVDRLVRALDEGFRGTAQPTPAACGAAPSCPTIWYLEAGYQTAPDAAHRALYTGRENDARTVDDVPAAGAGGPSQAAQLTAGVALASCQPSVGAFFNFLLWDEPELERWQSGVLWLDGSRKASFDALRGVAAAVASGSIDCARLAASSPAASQPAPNALVDRLEWSPLAVFSRFNEVWSFAIAARVDARYRARIYRVGASRRAGGPTGSGLLARGRPRVVRFPTRRLLPARYRIEVVVTRRRAPRLAVTHRSPPFVVR
jgi:hypothetical protein